MSSCVLQMEMLMKMLLYSTFSKWCRKVMLLLQCQNALQYKPQLKSLGRKSSCKKDLKVESDVCQFFGIKLIHPFIRAWPIYESANCVTFLWSYFAVPTSVQESLFICDNHWTIFHPTLPMRITITFVTTASVNKWNAPLCDGLRYKSE